MNKIVYYLLLKLEQCDDKHKRCDYLMEHDEITYLLEYIEMLEERRKQCIKQKEVLDKIKEKVNQYEFISGYYDDNYDGEDTTYSHDTLKEDILELLEELDD